MNKHLNKGHRWQKGESGNLSGRPVGARQKIAEALLNDLHEVWEEHGKTVLTKLAVSDPGKLAQIAYGLLPRDIFIQVQQGGSPESADQRASLRRILDIIESCAPDAGPEILDDIEQYLRARNAREVGSSVSNALAIEHSGNGKANSDQ